MKGLIPLLFPPRCVFCEARAEADLDICQACLSQLTDASNASNACCGCALPLPDCDAERCGRCLRQPPDWDHAAALWYYQGMSQWLIQQYKYQGQIYLGRSIGHLLAAYARQHFTRRFDQVMAVPLNDRRLLSRGFNQAQELAAPVARALDCPLQLDGIRRPRHLRSLVREPGRNQRRQSVANAFVCRANVTGQQILLVDDVMTSGATMGELSRLLKQHGAASVTVLVAARTQNVWNA